MQQKVCIIQVGFSSAKVVSVVYCYVHLSVVGHVLGTFKHLCSAVMVHNHTVSAQVLAGNLTACCTNPALQFVCRFPQVQRLARRLRLPIRNRPWVINGCDTGVLDPPLTLAGTPNPASPLASSSPKPQHAATNIPQREQLHPHTVRQTRHQVSRNVNAVHFETGDRSEADRGTKRGKRKRVELVVPESEQQDEERENWPAGPTAASPSQDRHHKSGQNKRKPCRTSGPYSDPEQRGFDNMRENGPEERGMGHRGDGCRGVGGRGAAGDRDEGVIEDSEEDDGNLMCSPDMDDMCSADTAQPPQAGSSGHRQSAATRRTAVPVEVRQLH